jgi:SAM-dependent methyltransferase
VGTPGERSPIADLRDDVSVDGVSESVRDGYDAVYDVLAQSPTFARIWRANAYRGDFPEEFAHIGFLTLREAGRLLELLGLGEGSMLVDVACGAGGPGLWAAQQSGASLVGVDPADAGLKAARGRARQVGLEGRSRFARGAFERTGLAKASADAVMTVEAFQYAPDKRTALTELRRVLRPAGRLGMFCFEVDPSKVTGVPVLGVDPIADYRLLLEECGFAVEVYEETPGWLERVYGVFGALIEARAVLTAEMGERAAAGVLAEAMLTVTVKPYPRRVLAVARRFDPLPHQSPIERGWPFRRRC